jgi:hypothetical protein
MDKLSEKKFGRKFTELSPAQGTAILDATMGQSGGDDLAQNAASFLARFHLTLHGGLLRYPPPVGKPSVTWAICLCRRLMARPQHVLDRVGVVQTVK